MPHPPDGLQAGALKPPLPLGIPSGRTAPAEISRVTLALQQVGHLGSGSLAESCKCSNSQWHDSQRYSYMGMPELLGVKFVEAFIARVNAFGPYGTTLYCITIFSIVNPRS